MNVGMGAIDPSGRAVTNGLSADGQCLENKQRHFFESFGLTYEPTEY
jgi:hypothetical protein